MKNLKEELEKMTGKDVVLAMVRGLEKEHVKVDMNWFGIQRDGICFGCAATNAICEITQYTFDVNEISDSIRKSTSLGVGMCVLLDFERALNYLRLGIGSSYNNRVEYMGLHNLLLPIPKKLLPELTTGNYKENLIHYVTYANSI